MGLSQALRMHVRHVWHLYKLHHWNYLINWDQGSWFSLWLSVIASHWDRDLMQCNDNWESDMSQSWSGWAGEIHIIVIKTVWGIIVFISQVFITLTWPFYFAEHRKKSGDITTTFLIQILIRRRKIRTLNLNFVTGIKVPLRFCLLIDCQP